MEFVWSEEVENAFQELQKEIADKPRVFKPDLQKPFYLITDGSSISLSGILTQRDINNNKAYPIEYYSKKLNETEAKYPSWKLELLAVRMAVENFHELLFGNKFTLITDAEILKKKINLVNQTPAVVRWIMFLQNYDFEIEHIKGEENPANYLSR